MQKNAEQLKEDAREAARATMPAKAGAEYMGVSYWKLLQMVKAGEIPHIRVGNRILFRRESLDRWLAEQEAGSVRKQEPVVVRGIRRLK